MGGWVGPSACVWRRQKFLAPARNWTPAVQPVARHCTDWANPAHSRIRIRNLNEILLSQMSVFCSYNVFFCDFVSIFRCFLQSTNMHKHAYIRIVCAYITTRCLAMGWHVIVYIPCPAHRSVFAVTLLITPVHLYTSQWYSLRNILSIPIHHTFRPKYIRENFLPNACNWCSLRVTGHINIIHQVSHGTILY
jgi:hypothetical protein